LPLADDAAAEGDDPPAAIADREDHPVAEVIVGRAAILGPAQQAAFDEQRLGDLSRERALQGLAALRGEAEAEAADRRLVEAAPLEIGEPGSARRTSSCAWKKTQAASIASWRSIWRWARSRSCGVDFGTSSRPRRRAARPPRGSRARRSA